jgi:hypothetical protein
VTRYEFFRKRIAPVLFLCMVGLIAYDAWKKEKHAGITGTVVIELGEAAPRVREVEAEMFVRGESVSVFRCAALSGAQIGDCRFEARMPAPDGELRLAIDVGEPARRRITRGVHLEDRATVHVDVGPELLKPAP